MTLEEFEVGLNSCTQLLTRGIAIVQDRKFEAILVRNLYGQEIVWGMFGTNRGKFNNRLSNSASTEGVLFNEVTSSK